MYITDFKDFLDVILQLNRTENMGAMIYKDTKNLMIMELYRSRFREGYKAKLVVTNEDNPRYTIKWTK